MLSVEVVVDERLRSFGSPLLENLTARLGLGGCSFGEGDRATLVGTPPVLSDILLLLILPAGGGSESESESEKTEERTLPRGQRRSLGGTLSTSESVTSSTVAWKGFEEVVFGEQVVGREGDEGREYEQQDEASSSSSEESPDT